MYTSSLSMLGHSLATWETGEFRQALALGSQVAIGTGSRLRLIPGADTNATLGGAGSTTIDHSPIQRLVHTIPCTAS